VRVPWTALQAPFLPRRSPQRAPDGPTPDGPVRGPAGRHRRNAVGKLSPPRLSAGPASRAGRRRILTEPPYIFTNPLQMPSESLADSKTFVAAFDCTCSDVVVLPFGDSDPTIAKSTEEACFFPPTFPPQGINRDLRPCRSAAPHFFYSSRCTLYSRVYIYKCQRWQTAAPLSPVSSPRSSPPHTSTPT